MILKFARTISLRFVIPLVAFGCWHAAAMAAALPQDHEYQKVLRAYLAGLAETNFTVEAKKFADPGTPQTPEELYRLWTLVVDPGYSCPLAGSVLSVLCPASQFTLAAIEREDFVRRPKIRPESLAWLSAWNQPWNPYFGLRALRNRAFVVAAIDMMMLDAVHEQKPPSRANRSDALGGTLISLAYTYLGVRHDLPPDVRKAYETGLKKFVARLDEWGPKGAMTDMDLFAPVGLRYAANALGDPETERIATAYSKRLFTDPRYFHPAGYFVDCGIFDASYNGISLFYTTWAALLSDWAFTREALSKAYRLKSYLTLPEPDGKSFYGPSHFSSRTSACSAHDQWAFCFRDIGAAMVTDEALYSTRLPSADELKQAPPHLIQMLNAQLTTPVTGDPPPWKNILEEDWDRLSWVSLNFAYDFYKKGFFERRSALEAGKSPLLQPPFSRPGRFIENFDNVFLVAKFDRFGVIVFTGPVAGDDGHWHRPYGFGGGALSAFWTPSAGPVLLGRRRGIQGNTFDTYEDWRSWPTHAVTGVTADGKVISSARIQHPVIVYDVHRKSAEIRVSGPMPKSHAQGEVLQGDILYSRLFSVSNDGLNIETKIKGDGKDRLAELYEVIPVFLGDRYLARPTNEPPVKISCKIGDTWTDATAQPLDKVTAVRVDRKQGAILIAFTRPCSVRLSPEPWVDGYLSEATCRNIMVDLLENKSKPGPIISACVKYKIAPATP